MQVGGSDPNLFRSDPSNQQYINDPMSRLRISPDGRTFGFVDAVGNDGIEEGEIPIAVLENVLGPQWTKYVSDLAGDAASLWIFECLKEMLISKDSLQIRY